MKVCVKLYGTLGKKYQKHGSVHGVEVKIPDDARVEDLLARLEIPKNSNYMVIINKKIAKFSDKIANKGVIRIFQALSGG